MPVIDAPKDPNGDRNLLPEGTYDFEVKGADAETRKKDGQLQLVLKCFSRASSAKNGAQKNATIRIATNMTRMLEDALKAMGVPYQQVVGAGGVPALRFDTDHCIGRVFRVECKHNNGYERWERFQPSTPGGAVAQQPVAAPPPVAPPTTALPAPTPYMPPQGVPYQPPPQAAPPAAPVQGEAPPPYAPPYQPPVGAPGYPPHQPYPAPGAPAPASVGAPPGYQPPPGYGYPPPGYPQGGQGQGGQGG